MADDLIIGAKQFPNPKKIIPQADEAPLTHSRQGMDTSNASGGLMTDLRNPAKSEIVVEKHHHDHPLIEHFERSPTMRRMTSCNV